MIATELPDELALLDVTGLDRAELIQRIRELERQRSAWELRVRACQERESLFLGFVNEMGQFMAQSFQAQHDTINVVAEKGAQLVAVIQQMVRKVESV